MKNEINIFESPDNGKTIYVRKFMSENRKILINNNKINTNYTPKYINNDKPYIIVYPKIKWKHYEDMYYYSD